MIIKNPVNFVKIKPKNIPAFLLITLIFQLLRIKIYLFVFSRLELNLV